MPNKYKVKVLEKKNLAVNYWYFKIEKPSGFEYQAGQYVSVLVDEATQERRSYSLASWPAVDDLELLVDTAPMGKGSKYFLELNEGSEIEFLGPLGQFVLRENNDEKRFVATGSGIVPMRAMIHELLETKKFGGKVTLNWGMRFESDLFWIGEWKGLAKEYSNFEFDLVLSKPTAEWQGCAGHIQDCLIKKAFNEECEVYICGGEIMVEEMQKSLLEMGVKADRIYFERFN